MSNVSIDTLAKVNVIIVDHLLVTDGTETPVLGIHDTQKCEGV